MSVWKLLMAVLAVPLVLCGQEVDSVSMSSDMGEVAVYGRQRDEIVPSQRLSGERLEALRTHSVADALRYFSGVQIKDYGGVGGLKTVDVRSMGTNHMGVFYDGIQLGNAQNGLVDLGRFSMENIEEIALYNGQKAQIFQPARDFGTSGSVYIRTRRPQFDEGKVFNIRAVLRGGSFGVISPVVVWEQKWSRRVSSMVSADYTGADGKYSFRYRRVLPSGTVAWDTTAVRQNGDLRSFRIEGAVFGNTDDGTWNAKVYYYDSNRGIPGAVVNNVWRFAQRQWDRNLFVQGGWVKHVSERYKFRLSGKYANDWMRYLNPDATTMLLDNRFRQNEVYFSMAHNVELLPKWELNVSADYQFNSLDANLVNFAYPRRHTLLVAFATQYQLGRFRAMASVLGTNVWDKTMVEQVNGRDVLSRWTPAVYVSYSPIKDNTDLSLRFFYKKIFRLPTFNDLYYTEVGSINLKPENTLQLDLGLIYQHDWRRGVFRHLELKADGYYNRVDNKIIAVPKGSGQYRWMMMNVGKVRILGVETTAQTVMRWCRDWSLVLCANYTYQSAQDRTDASDDDPYYGTYGGQIAYIPWHSGSATGNLKWRRLALNYAFVYVGERYRASSNIRENYEQPWYTHDLSVSYTISGNRRARALNWFRCMMLTLECNNVFDQQYDVVPNYPMPGRNWRGVIRLEL